MLIIGAAHALGQWVGLAGGITVLSRRVGSWTVGADISFLLRALGRSVAMGGLAWLALRWSADIGDAGSLTIAVLVGILVYGVLLIVSGSDREALRSRRGEA